jgi:Xaa-Pro aminopeptidase
VLRPGDPVYYDILHSYMGYRTCYYRCFAISSASRALVDAYKRCRDYLDASIELIRPGRTTAEVAAVWPSATEFGFPDEESAFALQMGHGIGLAIWEKPMISRLVSLEHPHEIKPGMVFALETFWPATDGWSAARIEEDRRHANRHEDHGFPIDPGGRRAPDDRWRVADAARGGRGTEPTVVELDRRRALKRRRRPRLACRRWRSAS